MMELLVPRCAFIDIHRDTAVTCVRTPDDAGGRCKQTRTFGTTTSQILQLRDWLAELQVTLVGMESTGIYWKPIYYLLEDDFECWLINATHMHNVPGKKTDVLDAEWGAELIEHGLVRPSFVPPRPIRELRDLTRYRKSVIEERGREVQRLHKVLEDAGIKLASVASKTLTKSGRDMLDALVGGQRDPQVLAAFARGRMRAKIGQLQEALEGHFGEHHALIVAQMLARIDHADATIDVLSQRIAQVIAPFEHQVELLCTIPGVKRRTAEVIIAEIGADMSRFPTSAHLASWAGVCPGNNESAGKHKSGKTRKGSKWLRKALVESAHAAARSKDTYLAAQYARLRGRRGPKKAAVAVGHSILVIAYHLLERDVAYHELGGDFYVQLHARHKQAYTNRLVHQLENLGYQVQLADAA
jgi:transposase